MLIFMELRDQGEGKEGSHSCQGRERGSLENLPEEMRSDFDGFWARYSRKGGPKEHRRGGLHVQWYWGAVGPGWGQEHESREAPANPKNSSHTGCQAQARHFPRISSTPSTTCSWSNNHFFTSQLKNGCPT